MPLTVLLTGFGPFHGAPFNPATALPTRLAARRRPAFAELRRIAHVFRTSYATVDNELPALLARTRPDVMLLFGVATRSKYLRVELRARNARSPLFPDVDGRRPNLTSIATGAPAVRRGRAPQAVLLAAIRKARLPVRLSHSAGRYLCNFAYWHALAATAGGRLPVVQFIHVPTVRREPVQRGVRRRLTAADLARAGEAVLMALIVAARARQREERSTQRPAEHIVVIARRSDRQTNSTSS